MLLYLGEFQEGFKEPLEGPGNSDDGVVQFEGPEKVPYYKKAHTPP